MFGPIMQFRANSNAIKLAPVWKDDMAEFIRDGGMHMHSVTRWMGRQNHPSLESEHEFYERIQSSQDSVFWGIFVRVDEEWRVIGSTSLNCLNGKPYKGAVSGFLIFRPDWWGKGIASVCHRARTLYAFDYLNLAVIRSAVMDGNTGSLKALLKCGYVPVGTERNATFQYGEWHHQTNLELVNPSPDGWRNWWHSDAPPKSFREARKSTLEVLDWARENVELL